MTGAVIVTTPQDIALLDARKGIKMFEKVGVPILGIVENMAVHVCSQCGHVEHIFGADGGKKMAAEYGMDYLGALPLDIQIRLQADSGQPHGGGGPRRRCGRHLQDRGAPGGDQDRRQGQGFFVEVSVDQDFEGYLRAWRLISKGNRIPSVGWSVVCYSFLSFLEAGWPGCRARRPTHFLLLRQEKVGKEKASRASGPLRFAAGCLALLETGGRLRNSGLRPSDI
jgi:hypothetical protein